jgi:osmotically-inducible protein OsmY
MPRKTDSEVEQWVLRELSLSEIRSPEVSVFSRDGVITLRGSAQTYQDKLAVEEATRRATGVVGVVNEITVKPCTALVEKVSARVPLTELPSPGVLVQPKAIQRPVVHATTA